MNEKLKTGDTVYVTDLWRKDGILVLPCAMVHGQHAKVGGRLLQLGKHFFVSRGEALEDLRRRHRLSIQQAEIQHKKHLAEVDRILRQEEERLRAEGRVERAARREELAARGAAKLADSQ